MVNQKVFLWRQLSEYQLSTSGLKYKKATIEQINQALKIVNNDLQGNFKNELQPSNRRLRQMRIQREEEDKQLLSKEKAWKALMKETRNLLNYSRLTKRQLNNMVNDREYLKRFLERISQQESIDAESDRTKLKTYIKDEDESLSIQAKFLKSIGYNVLDMTDKQIYNLYLMYSIAFLNKEGVRKERFHEKEYRYFYKSLNEYINYKNLYPLVDTIIRVFYDAGFNVTLDLTIYYVGVLMNKNVNYEVKAVQHGENGDIEEFAVFNSTNYQEVIKELLERFETDNDRIMFGKDNINMDYESLYGKNEKKKNKNKSLYAIELEFRKLKQGERKKTNGAFLKYQINSNAIKEIDDNFNIESLKDLQICSNDSEYVDNVPCAIHCLKLSGHKYSNFLVNNRDVKIETLNKLLKSQNIGLDKRALNKKGVIKTLKFNKELKDRLKIDYYKGHYMLSSLRINFKNKEMSPLEFCRECENHDLFIDLNVEKLLKFNRTNENKTKSLDGIDLETTKVGKGKAKKFIKKDVHIFADTETYNDNGFHKPYQVAFTLKSQIRCFTGFDCIDKMLRLIVLNHDKSNVVMYFHNMSFDIYALLQNKNIKWRNFLKGGFNFYRATFCYMYKGKSCLFELRDSYKMISTALRNFGKMFNLDVAKAEYPYDLVTYDLIKNNEKVNIESCYPYIKDIKQFKIDTKPFTDCFNKIDLLEYSEYYCKLDVAVLKKGFMKNRNTLLKSYGLDTFDYLTSSSLAVDFYKKKGALEGCPEIKGALMEYMGNFVVGGRCMLAYNADKYVEKCDENEFITDYDANSLYPSSYIRLCEQYGGLPTEIVKSEAKTFEDLEQRIKDKKIRYYFGKFIIKDIRNTNVAYSNIAIRTKEGVLDWRSDKGLIGETVYFSNIKIDTMRNFENPELELIEALEVPYNSVNGKVGEVTKKIYKERLQAKKEGNSIKSDLIKLIMNSFYGKQIQKARYTKTVIQNEENHDIYLNNNAPYINKYFKHNNQTVIEQYDDINNQNNLALNGILILDCSKLIMNDTIYDCKPFVEKWLYTDTDSLQFKITKDNYKKLKNMSVYGNDLGQFKVDYKKKDGETEDPYCKEAYYLGKKLYACKLNNDSVHMKMKGIISKLIKWEHFEIISSGVNLIYNLTKAKPCFKKHNTKIEQIKEFKRVVTTKNSDIDICAEVIC